MINTPYVAVLFLLLPDICLHVGDRIFETFGSWNLYIFNLNV